MTPAALLTSVDVTHEAKTSPFATCPAAAGRPQPASQHQFRQQAAQPPATAAARASSSSSNSSSSSSSGSSVAFIQACRARRGAINLKDAWRCKTQLQAQAQHPSPNGDSSSGPSTNTLPAVNTEQGQPGAVDELELALSGWLWDQEEDWPLDTTDQTEPELHCLDSCWSHEDARLQAPELGLPQTLSLTESAGQLREVLDHIFSDIPDAAPLAAPCSAAASQPSAERALLALLVSEASLDAVSRLPQDLIAPLSPFSCSKHTSAASAATATCARAAEHMQQDGGVDLDLDLGLDLGLDLQRRWSELAVPANSSGVQSDCGVQRWAELAPRTGLKRRWSELPLEGVGVHAISSSSSKSPKFSLNLGTMHPASPEAPPGCSGQDAQPNRPAAAQGMRTHSLPPLMAYLKQQQQQQQEGQQQVVQAASAEPWSRQLGAGKAAAAGASSPAPPAQQPKPFASCQAATLQSLLEWQALSHRVVSAAAAPDQANAWSLLTDAELQRFLSKTALKRPGGGGGGGGRQQMIDSIKRTVVSARAGGR